MNKYLYFPLHKFVILFLLSMNCYSQSTNKVAGDSLKRKTEIGLNNLNIYRHFNKYQIDGRNLRTPEILDRLSSIDSSDYNLYQKGRKERSEIGHGYRRGRRSLLIIANIVELGSAISDIGNSNVNSSSDHVAFIALSAMGGAFVVGGFIKIIMGKKVKNKAINNYNQHISLKKHTSGFYVKPGLTGFSIGLKF